MRILYTIKLTLLLFTLTLCATALAMGPGHDSGHTSGGSHGSHDDDGGDSDHGSSGHGSHKGKSGRGHADASHGQGHSGASTLNDKVLRGRRPPWASPDFPEIELGRLNVARAPNFVLQRAWSHAEEENSAAMAVLYQATAEQAAELLVADYANVSRFHSPVQNLALYQAIMTFGSIEFFTFETQSYLDLAAIFLGSASEKTIPITQDTVVALNRILGLNAMAPDEQALLAAKAELVREAILTGHGDEGSHDD